MAPLFRRTASALEQQPEGIGLLPVAFVRNGVSRPRTSGWESIESTITLAPGLSPDTLGGITGFSHVLVIFWLDRLGADRPAPSRVTVGVVDVGVFASRSQLRPNPIGVSVVQLLGAEGDALRVRGLDALDGTPVLDVKPYVPFYDSVASATVPSWVYGR